MTSNCVKLVWLIVLSMLMGAASAANIDFSGSTVPKCPLAGSTYNCTTAFAPGSNDIIVIASGYTVVLSNAFTPGWDQGLTMSGSAALQTSSGNAIDLTGSNNINVSGGTLTAGGNFKLGSNAQTITANVVAASVTTGGAAATINGNLTTTGNADLGSHTTISGTVKVGTITTNSDVSMGALIATGSISLGSKTSVSGVVSGASISTNSQVTLGSLSVSGTADLGSQTAVNGAISANILTTNSNVTLNGNVTANTSVTLGSGSDLTGNITAPNVTLHPSNVTVKGNVAASSALNMGSGTTVTGNVSGGSLLMRPANATINGSVTLSGDVDMGSQSNINGDLVARDVLTRSSFAIINGNAAVNSIYIDWHDSVTKTITCTGPGAVGCSCVTKADPNYMPTCGAPAGATHHFQISHSGSALTCQPQTVTVTACANANCTGPHYTSNVNVTLQPGDQTFTVSGGVNAAATVQSKKAGIFTLSATASGVSNATTCLNSGAGQPCDMAFKDTGLVVSVPNHIAMKDGVLVTIQALKDQPGQPSCVPLVAGKTVDIDMACSYQNPASGSQSVVIGARTASCGANTFGSSTTVSLPFDASGKASATLQYPDVGRVALSASYAESSLSATGNDDFIAAPAAIQLTATNAAGTRSYGPATLNAMPVDVFAKASENFTLTATAVNDKGVATPNFGKESVPSRIRFTPTVNKWDDTPAAVAAPVANGTGSAGALTYAFSTPFSGGRANASANFDNVGYLKISAALDDGVTSANAYYLGDPLSFQPTGTQYVARFIPDHFDTELMADSDIKDVLPTTHMDCSKALLNPCSADSTRFINSGQSFFLKVTAYNGAATPAIASNYAGSLAKLIDLSAFTAKGGTTAADGAITWSGGSAAARYTFSAGVGLLPTSAGTNLPVFTFAKSYPNNVLPSNIYLRASDADGATSLRSAAVEAPLAVVGGRLQVANAFGSPTAPLPVGVTAQYYTAQGYIYNPQLNATSSAAVADRLTFSNCQRALAVATCPASLKASNSSAKLTLTRGVGKFSIAAPTPTVSGIGRVDVQLLKGADQLFPYLPSSTGTATFGLYPSGPVIYMREIY